MRRFRGVIVDDEIERDRPMPAGKSLQNEVLDPDARMEEFGLMSGDQPALAGPVGNWFPGLFKVTTRRRQRFRAGQRTQIGQRSSQQPRRLRKAAAIGFEDCADVLKRRIDQKVAVLPGSFQA